MSASETRSKKKSKERTESNEKKNEEIPVSQIHTPNDWEHADLGDEQRKQKFLRLMGVKKRKDEHSTEKKTGSDSDSPTEGEQHQEKKHCRSKEETESMNRELEKQYNEGLHSKLTHQRHGGLGFQGETSSSSDWHQETAKLNFVPASKSSTDTDESSKKTKETDKKAKSKSSNERNNN